MNIFNFRNRKIRSLFSQIIVVVLILLFFYNAYYNATINIQDRGIQLGFDFLYEESGFDVLFSLIEYDATHTYLRSFFVGLLNTLLVSAFSMVFAVLIGFFIGILRISNNWLAKNIANIYIEIIRNIPLLLQILFWYFFIISVLPSPKNSFNLLELLFLNNRGLFVPIPIMNEAVIILIVTFVFSIICIVIYTYYTKYLHKKTGRILSSFYIKALIILVSLSIFVILLQLYPFEWDTPKLGRFSLKGGVKILPEFMALSFALIVYTSAFIGEIVRSGISSVGIGQREAALSLGLSKRKILKLIIIPQAMRAIIPPLISQMVNLTKNSSLATAIGYPDLVAVFAGTALNQSGNAIEIMSITLLVYLSISLITSFFMNIYNSKTALISR